MECGFVVKLRTAVKARSVAGEGSAFLAVVMLPHDSFGDVHQAPGHSDSLLR